MNLEDMHALESFFFYLELLHTKSFQGHVNKKPTDYEKMKQAGVLQRLVRKEKRSRVS